MVLAQKKKEEARWTTKDMRDRTREANTARQKEKWLFQKQKANACDCHCWYLWWAVATISRLLFHYSYDAGRVTALPFRILIRERVPQKRLRSCAVECVHQKLYSCTGFWRQHSKGAHTPIHLNYSVSKTFWLNATFLTVVQHKA